MPNNPSSEDSVAKKKTEEVKQEQPPAGTLKPAYGRTIAAWRERALAELPTGTDDELAARINGWVREGGYDYLATAEDIRGWKIKREAAPTPVARVRSAAVSPSGPSLADLLAVKQLADEDGGVAKLADKVADVKAAADKVGGLDALSACLEALVKLTGGK